MMSALWRLALALALPALLWGVAHLLIVADARRQTRAVEEECARMRAELELPSEREDAS